MNENKVRGKRGERGKQLNICPRRNLLEVIKPEDDSCLEPVIFQPDPVVECGDEVELEKSPRDPVTESNIRPATEAQSEIGVFYYDPLVTARVLLVKEFILSYCDASHDLAEDAEGISAKIETWPG